MEVDDRPEVWKPLASSAMTKLIVWREAMREISEAWREHHGWDYREAVVIKHEFARRVMLSLAKVGLVAILQDEPVLRVYWIHPDDQTTASPGG